MLDIETWLFYYNGRLLEELVKTVLDSEKNENQERKKECTFSQKGNEK